MRPIGKSAIVLLNFLDARRGFREKIGEFPKERATR
jgi:hypothetical protein